jgi:hypothetical protein
MAIGIYIAKCASSLKFKNQSSHPSVGQTLNLKKDQYVVNELPWHNFECSEPWLSLMKLANILTLIVSAIELAICLREKDSLPWYRTFQATSDVAIWVHERLQPSGLLNLLSFLKRSSECVFGS